MDSRPADRTWESCIESDPTISSQKPGFNDVLVLCSVEILKEINKKKYLDSNNIIQFPVTKTK